MNGYKVKVDYVRFYLFATHLYRAAGPIGITAMTIAIAIFKPPLGHRISRG